jgi:putative glutamine amidotransferase
LDGLVLPGSGSFVHPRHYDAEPVDGREYDEGRDAAAFALLRAADLPVLASCRGMQELAVHHGAKLDVVAASPVPHRLRAADRWAPAHPVDVRPGGLLANLAEEPSFEVNSQHTDHVVEVPADLRVEAVAPDGLVEAFSVGWPERFELGIQWHFEHGTTALDRRILAEFGQRCAARAERWAA